VNVREHILKRELTVPRPLKEVFAFFDRPENLGALTPPDMGFRILTPPPLEMRRDAVVDYIVTVSGLPVRWTTLITDYDPPHRFVDLQLRGPYAWWHHTHEFEALAGGTVIRDTVRYGMPFGPLGELAHALAVQGRLQRIFAFRDRVIRAKFTD